MTDRSPTLGALSFEAWSAEEAACLDPDQELEVIELGNRVAWDLTMMMVAATTYSDQSAREWSVSLMLLGQVADGIRRARGIRNVTGHVPPEWVPLNDSSEPGAA